ncbi:hypothetical protein [Clostridium felsineum]|uniref:Uncharacterized protein n=1 Tax=Clostridium felsineum TaxID=36839 RepID=A0A1S8KYC0_9CLOT|nr:hypothetical protein [Clostridium felsineum]URZ09750.1 hypothetical protein CROST_004430 [Clostridium felsineum]
MKRYSKYLVLIFIVCLAIFIKFIYVNSPEKAMFFYDKINNYSNNKILKKTTLNQNSKLFILMNKQTIYIYIINKNSLNHWKVTNMVGVNDIYNQKNNSCAVTTLNYNRNIKYSFIYWGVTNFTNIKK